MNDGKYNPTIFWLHLHRLAHILYVVVRHTMAHFGCYLLGRWPRLVTFLAIKHLSGPQRLRDIIEDVGGTFIKFGQVMALQPDVLPREYCHALFALLDRVAPFAFSHVEQTFQEELGRRPLELFDSFSPRPFATGSIGQVHLAKLDERSIAVKVRRPTVEKDFSIDLNLITALIKLIKISHLRKLYWLITPLSEFVSWTSEELDYRNEADYIEQLGVNAKENPHERIPAVLWNYSTRRTLAIEYLQGPTILDYIRAIDNSDGAIAAVPASFDPECFARNIIHNFIGDALRHGIFHADLHPANLMIMPENKVGYIDFGIVGKLDPYSRYYLIAMTLSYACGDLEQISASFFKVSTVSKDSNVEGFKTGLKALAEQWYSPGQDKRLRKSITLVMLDLLNLSKATDIWPRQDVIRYIRSAIVLDGLVKNFAPNIDLGRHLEHICEQHYLWYELEDLISSDKRMTTSLMFVPKEERDLARRELENLQESVQHFGLIDPGPELDLINLYPLAGKIQEVSQMERFDALWATEGLGFLVAEAALKVNQCPVKFLSCQKFGPLPASALAAIHVGVSLSVARRLLKMAQDQENSFSLSDAIKIFFERCESRSPEGCRGVAVEALGLVVRTLSPQWLLDVDQELQRVDPNLVGYFWHGVGRGLYFIFPPALYSRGSHSIALEKAWQDPPHETGRVNSLAGLAWPLTLVNIRHPQILAAFLKKYASEIPGNGAFSTGIATSILLWLAWAGHDQHLSAFMHYQHTALGDAAQWINLVRSPCLEVMAHHHQALAQTRRYGELFCYQPVGALAERLDGKPYALRATANR